MNIIVISNPENIPNEHQLIESLFEEGLEYFHLRKPTFSNKEMEEFIKQIPEKHHNRVVLHAKIPSFHSLKEIEEYQGKYNYALLSPIFDSISKIGYKSNFDLQEVKSFLQRRRNIIALGGVDEDKIETVRELGFAGVALLGAIWQSENPIEKFKRILRSCSEVIRKNNLATDYTNFHR